jgi:tryptophan-rich sensory protein
MQFLLDHPVLLFVVSFGFLWAANRLGKRLQVWHRQLDDPRKSDFDIVLGATVTLLSLIVGFSFSMAAGRYDQRKNLEEAEANAIGTAYARADLLAESDAAPIKQLLRDYTALRIRFYTTVDPQQVRDLNRDTLQTQGELWKRTVAAATDSPTVVKGLAASAMNDALNAQGYAQAAAWNRLPLGAWVLMYVLGAVAAAMFGYRFQLQMREYVLTLIMPAMVATAFFLIADIDCPRHGTIRVLPQNLIALAATLR